MPYGKALGTYRRINRIQQASQNISQASNLIGEQRAKALDEARGLEMDRNVASSVAQGLTTGATAVMPHLDKFEGINIDPDRSAKIAAGLGFVSSAAGRGIAGGMSDDGYAGLGQEGVDMFSSRDDFNPFDDAATAYATDQAFNEIRRMKSLLGAVKEHGENEFGFTPEELKRTATDDPNLRDFSNLPELTLRRIYNQNVRRGYEDPTDDLEAMRSWYFNNQNRRGD